MHIIKDDNLTNRKEIEKVLVQKGIFIPNFDNCKKILKKHYNIPEDKTIIVKNLQFDTKFNMKINDTTLSDSSNFEFFDPVTKDKLNSTLCNEVKSSIKIPFKQSSRLKMQEYEEALVYINIMDIYNAESIAFNTRCVRTNDFKTNGDTSVNFRRTKLYQNETIKCSEGCIYNGLDENKYVKCDCNLKQGVELSNNSSGILPLIAFPSFNYNIAICIIETIQDVS